MSMETARDRCLNLFRKTRPQSRVWSAAIVVSNEFTEDALQMPLVQRNQIVQALAPNTANHPLAISIRHRASDRRHQHSQAKALHCRINFDGEDAVTVVNEKSMAGFSIQELTELLSGPIGSRMIRHIAVKNPPRANLDRDKDVQDLKRSGHRGEQVAGDDLTRMIVNERRPTLTGWLPRPPTQL